MNPISLPLVKYVLKASVRDKLIISMIISLVVASALSIFMGSAAVVEQDLFTLIFAAASLRMISILGLVLFIVFFVRRSFENKDIEFLLSRPLSRVRLIGSYSCAMMTLATMIALAVFCVIYAISPQLYQPSYGTWLLSFWIEIMVMANTALFFSMVIKSAPSATMVICGFYVLCRMMGQILGIIDGFHFSGALQLLSMGMEFISALLPRLDLLAQTSWLVYGTEEGTSLVYACVQGIVFSVLVLSAAAVDFIRKEF